MPRRGKQEDPREESAPAWLQQFLQASQQQSTLLQHQVALLQEQNQQLQQRLLPIQQTPMAEGPIIDDSSNHGVGRPPNVQPPRSSRQEYLFGISVLGGNHGMIS